MRRKKKWMAPKPKYVHILLNLFLTTLTIVWGALYIIIALQFEDRLGEMSYVLTKAMIESLNYSSLYNGVLLANQTGKELYIPRKLYHEYESIMQYLTLNDDYPTVIIKRDGNGDKPEVIMDNFTPKVFCSYINSKDSNHVFEFQCYQLYEDDPKLTEFMQHGLMESNIYYGFEAETIYINPKTMEFVPESVQWIKYNENGGEPQIIATYTREQELPKGFVKDEERNNRAVFQQVAKNHTLSKQEMQGKWYEKIPDYGANIPLLYAGDAAEQLQKDLERGFITNFLTEGFWGWGPCYRSQTATIQLIDSHGEVHDYEIIRSMKYNLLEYYWKSIVNTALICALATYVFSMVVAYIIYLKRLQIWQQNAFCRTLTNAVAHDLKTPLMVISSMADNLKENVTEERPLYYAEQVTNTVSYMNGMIEDILDLNRMEGNKPIIRAEKVELAKLLAECVDNVQPIITEKQLVFTILGEGQCKGDYALLRQAFGNLVDNAVKYTPDGGEVIVEISKRRVSITNTGVSLTKKFMRKAFEPFTKVDAARSNRNGSGVGLTIAKSIFDAHGMKCRMTGDAQSVTVIVRL